MTALDKDTIRDSRVRNNVAVGSAPIANGATVHLGGIVCFDATGSLVPGSDTAGLRPAGILRKVDNGSQFPIFTATGNSEYNIFGTFEFANEVLMDVNPAARDGANIDKNVYIKDDNTVTGLADVTNNIMFGKIVEFTTSSFAKAYVSPRVYGNGNVSGSL